VLPDELSVIDRFFRPLAGEGAFDLRDDAAVVAPPPGHELVVTTDMVARGVHFLDDPPDTIAKKALRVNLSDLAAKGATPIGYVMSIGLSPEIDEPWLAGFADGLRDDQRAFAVRLLGGDTIAVPDRTVISVAAFGHVPKGRMVRRRGARPGDRLYVSGAIGGSAAGLALIKKEPGPWSKLGASERQDLIHRYRVPDPKTALAPVLIECASAAIDVSDGLVGDCDKICAASNCSASIEADKVPFASGLGRRRTRDLIARLLTHGEDFEVLAAVATQKCARFEELARGVGVSVTEIGRLTEGYNLATVLFEGAPLSLSRRAFVHGAVK
jgi:thiamine-monophosphate kinase